MSISVVLPYIQIALALLLVGGVLLQRTDASLGAAFGADSFSSGNFTRRGGEKILFRATIIIAALFVVSAFLGLILK